MEIKTLPRFKFFMEAFRDRFEAGKKLAGKLQKYRGNAVVIGIPRGGLQVGKALANELECNLDCIVVKKLPHPLDPEFGVGAVSPNRTLVNQEVVALHGIGADYLARKGNELRLAARELDLFYHGGLSRVELSGKVAILTDDGAATGETICAAVAELRRREVAKIVLALPVAAPETWKKLLALVDEGICLFLPENFQAVGHFYSSFQQLSQEEARSLLKP